MSLMPYLEKIGFYESLVIIAIFSALVIITDEILHSRMRKRREAQGGKPAAH
jgi:hypothetical protein